MPKIVVVAHIKQLNVTYYIVDIYEVFCFFDNMRYSRVEGLASWCLNPKYKILSFYN